jgi:hypothetical protein
MKIIKKKEKTSEFKIINSMKKAFWESIPCICQKDNIRKSHPIQMCEYCRSKICWDSVPKKSWIVKDAKGKEREISLITLIRGQYDDVIGWNF